MNKKTSLTIKPVRLGGLPLVHAVAQKLDLMTTLEHLVPTDPRDKIPVSQTLYVILCNVILERFPQQTVDSCPTHLLSQR